MLTAAPVLAQGRNASLRGNPGQFFGPDSYPPEALSKREQGRVVARLTIDPTGKVTDCHVVESSGSTALDVQTCVIAVGRVTFSPPTDGRGRAIASSYTLPVRWVLPEEVALPRRSVDERMIVTLGTDDRVESCTFTGTEMPESGRAWFCERSTAELRARLPALRARIGTGRVEIVMQHAIVFPGHPVAEAQAQPGHMVLVLQRAFFDIAPDGTAANEQITEQVGTRGTLPDPISTLRRFEAAPATSRVQVLFATSWSTPPAAAGAVTPAQVPLAQGGATGPQTRDNPAAYFGIDAYPPEAVRRHEQGRTVADLAVGPDGRVTGCTIAQTSSSTALDATTCRIARDRLTFTPARDEGGRAVASHYTLPVRWVLPANDAIPLAAMTMVLDATINASRTVVTCTVTINGERASTSLDACNGLPEMFAVAFAAQATGAQANTVRAIVERRSSYGQDAAPGRPIRGAVLLAETVTRFRIEADGKPHGCHSGAGDGDYLLHGDNPCRDNARFDLVNMPASRLPIEATWSTTASYTRITHP